MSNPHITPAARALLQRLTAKLLTLDYRTDEETWHIGSEQLIGKKAKAAREILHLCALERDSEMFPFKRYRISREGTRILLRPDYTPAIIAAKFRPKNS